MCTAYSQCVHEHAVFPYCSSREPKHSSENLNCDIISNHYSRSSCSSMGFVYRFIIIYFVDIDFGIYKNAMLAIWIEMLVDNVWIKKAMKWK